MPAKTHAMIRRTFRFRKPQLSIPWGSSQKYGRAMFPVLFAKLNFTVGAEIGVRKGKFSKLLCQANPNLHLRCIDPWMAYNRYSQERQDSLYAQACENLKECKCDIIRKTSMDAVDDFPDRSFDFIYIDGNHEFDFVMQDIIRWVPKIRVGGIMALHDYHHGECLGVIEAIDAYTKAHHIDPWYVTKESQPTAYWVVT